MMILGTGMMRSLELSRYRRANVWLDEAPPADFGAASVVTQLVKREYGLEMMARKADIKQVDAIVRDLGLSREQRRLLHDEITLQWLLPAWFAIH
jgi:hypothetical protein